MAYLFGSCYFFFKMPDFKIHDVDLMEFADIQTTSEIWCVEKIEWYKLKKEKKEDFLKRIIVPSDFTVLLVPEIAKEINFTIKDFDKISHLIPYLDEKHRYLEVIYNAYLENGDFYLTDAQRAAAYEVYKAARPEYQNS